MTTTATTTTRTTSSTRRSRRRCTSTRGSVATTKRRSSNRNRTSSKRNGSSIHNHPSQPVRKAADDHDCDDASDCPYASAAASSNDCNSKSNTNSSIVFVDTIDDLEQITQEHVQLAIWRRHAIPKFVQTLKQLSTAISTDFDPVSCLPNFECIVTPEETYELLKAHLYCPYNLRSKQDQVVQDPELFELIHDIAGLVKVFATIAKTECVNIKLEVVTDNGCQYWHQDSVPVRMVVTYHGPCTEYIPPETNHNTRGMTVLEQYRTTNICPAHYQPTSLTHYDVAVFKGRGATTEESPLLDSTKGIVHRSPRLFATNDDDQDDNDNDENDNENDGSDDNDPGNNNGNQSGTFRWVLVLDIPVEGWHY